MWTWGSRLRWALSQLQLWDHPHSALELVTNFQPNIGNVRKLQIKLQLAQLQLGCFGTPKGPKACATPSLLSYQSTACHVFLRDGKRFGNRHNGSLPAMLTGLRLVALLVAVHGCPSWQTFQAELMAALKAPGWDDYEEETEDVSMNPTGFT